MLSVLHTTVMCVFTGFGGGGGGGFGGGGKLSTYPVANTDFKK